MEIGKGFQTKPVKCLNCGYEMDGASGIGVEDTIRPKAGDVCVCINCAHIQVYVEGGQIREPTVDELLMYINDDNILRLVGSILLMRRDGQSKQ